MKTLFAVVLATVMMAAPVKAVDNVVVDAETIAAVDTEVKKEIARLSKVSPAVALAMKSEASKKQMYAIIAGSVLAAAGLYALADWYFEIYFFKPKAAVEATATADCNCNCTAADATAPAPAEAEATV